MTVRSEGQFNTVVYDTEDRYHGISERNVVLMNKNDMTALDFPENCRVTVKRNGNDQRQKAVAYPIKDRQYYDVLPRNQYTESKKFRCSI